MSKLISVIIPVYNVEHLLPRCLDSLLSQSYRDIELILVNDGSRDESLSVAEQYAHHDSRIKVFTQDNAGQSAARNAAMKHATGEYIAFVDSDDSLAPDTLQIAIEALEQNPDCDAYQMPIRLEVGREGYEHMECSGRGIVLGSQAVIDAFAVGERMTWRVCDKVFRRSVLEGLRFREGVVYEDNLYMCEAMIRMHGVYLGDGGCYLYHWNANSTTHAPSPKSWVDMAWVHVEIYKAVAQEAIGKVPGAHILAIVCNDIYASWRAERRHTPIIGMGLQLLRRVSISSFIGVKSIPLKRRLKMLAIKCISIFGT